MRRQEECSGAFHSGDNNPQNTISKERQKRIKHRTFFIYIELGAYKNRKRNHKDEVERHENVSVDMFVGKKIENQR